MCACEFSVFSMQCYTHSAALEDVTHIHLLRSSSLIFVVAFLMVRGSLPYIFIAFDVRHADLVTFKWDDLSPLMHMAGCDEPTYVMKLTSLKVLATETTTDAIATNRIVFHYLTQCICCRLLFWTLGLLTIPIYIITTPTYFPQNPYTSPLRAKSRWSDLRASVIGISAYLISTRTIFSLLCYMCEHIVKLWWFNFLLQEKGVRWAC